MIIICFYQTSFTSNLISWESLLCYVSNQGMNFIFLSHFILICFSYFIYLEIHLSSYFCWRTLRKKNCASWVKLNWKELKALLHSTTVYFFLSSKTSSYQVPSKNLSIFCPSTRKYCSFNKNWTRSQGPNDFRFLLFDSVIFQY